MRPDPCDFGGTVQARVTSQGESMNAIFRVGLVFGLAMTCLAGYARADTVTTDPTFIWSCIGVCPQSGIVQYASPGAAYSVFSSTYEADCNASGPYTCSLSNFGPDPRVMSTNGRPRGYMADISFYSKQNGVLDHVAPQQRVVQAAVSCPDGYQQKSVVTGPLNQDITCELQRSAPQPSPRSCSAGNPVFIEGGLKVQSEEDYVSPNGLLAFGRQYRSDTGGFSSVASVAGLVNHSEPPS